MNHIIRKFRPPAALLLVLVLVMAPVAPLSGQGIAPCVHEARFGLLGLARLQVARLNVVNVLPPDPFTPPDPIHTRDPVAPPDPCHVAIGFLTTSAQPFVNDAGVAIIAEMDLRPGQSAFVELTSANAFRGSRDLRMPFRATGLFTHAGPPPDDDTTTPPDPCRAVVPSLEIYDVLTGRTQIVMSPLEIFDFGPAGATP
ncbi:MAG: hypothetical protein ACRD5G_10395 [Candidatus Acidiferrales bacterium]